MKYSLRLFQIKGIEVGVHYSWIFIFVLISWSLAQGYFPEVYPDWSTSTYWITGVIAALLLFVSVLLHEMGHSFVARSRGMEVGSITLFIFGGVSNLEEEPEKPKTEFVMSIVGPLVSLALAGIFFVFSQLESDQQSPLFAILSHLALLNLILAIFNMVPGFPLDGGRVLRSILWYTMGNLKRATDIAATVGRYFGWALIIFGFFQLLAGYLMSGIWLAIIGLFLSFAADASRHQLAIRQQLSKIKVKDVVNNDPPTVTPTTSISDLVSQVFRKQYGRAVPVCREGKLLGIVTVTDVKDVPQEEWKNTQVKQIYTSNPLHSVTPEDDLYKAFNLINKRDVNQLLVIRNEECAGLVSRADILNQLELSQEA